MGQKFSYFWSHSGDVVDCGDDDQSTSTSSSRSSSTVTNNRKRKRVTTAKRKQTTVKKRLKTSEYIYEKLFVNGENSDVTICAFGKQWKLHQVYLCQSLYFNSMFSGAWKESGQSNINLHIPDPAVTAKSFETVLGALYCDHIDIGTDPEDSVSLLAASALLQLESVLSHCSEVMAENLCCNTVVSFFDAAERYGAVYLKDACLEWLYRNLLHFGMDGQFLKEISIPLMEKLVSSNDLYIVQGEMDLYSLLQKWLYTQVNSDIVINEETFQTEVDSFVAQFCEKSSSFLECDDGHQYIQVFKHIRLCHIVTSIKTVDVLKSDNILPHSLINIAQTCQWNRLLQVETKINDTGAFPLISGDFDKRAMRCGRVLQTDSPHCWRWAGYNFGVDILLSYKYRTITLKRNCSPQTCPYSVNMSSEKTIFYRLIVSSFDEHRNLIWSHCSDIQKLILAPDQSHILVRIPLNVDFPLTVIFNYLTTPSLPEDEKIENEWKNILQVQV